MKKDLTGKTVGTWKVQAFSHKTDKCKHYYHVLCENCGWIGNHSVGTINSGKKCFACRGLSKGEGGCRRLWRYYKLNAKRANRELTLTYEQFKVITSSKCHYCGDNPKQVMLNNSIPPVLMRSFWIKSGRFMRFVWQEITIPARRP